MDDRIERDIREWLAAEAAGRDAQAEVSLTSAFRQVEKRAPGEGFAARVIAASRVGLAARPAWSPWMRGVVVACLCAAGVAFAMLPGVLLTLQPLVRVVAWPFVSTIIGWGTRAVSAAASVWMVLGDVAAALRVSLATSTALIVVLINVFVAAGSLFGLRRLLGGRQELVEC